MELVVADVVVVVVVLPFPSLHLYLSLSARLIFHYPLLSFICYVVGNALFRNEWSH